MRDDVGPPQTLINALEQKGVPVDRVQVDPELEQFTLDVEGLQRWLRTFDSVDEVCSRQVEYLQHHPLIPDQVTVSGWIYEVETGQLRPPSGAIGQRVNTSQQMTGE